MREMTIPFGPAAVALAVGACLLLCGDSALAFAVGVAAGIGLSYCDSPHVRLTSHILRILTSDALGAARPAATSEGVAGVAGKKSGAHPD